MSKLTDIGTTPDTTGYAFASGDIDDFLSEMEQPKQSVYEDNPDDQQHFDALNDAAEQREQQKQKLHMNAPVANASGKLVATVIDTTLPAALGFLAKDDPANYKADEQSREELERALSEYMKLKGGDIPPGMMILVLILTIYGAQLPIAIQRRKINTEREALERDQAQFERDRREYDKKLADLEARERKLSESDNP